MTRRQGQSGRKERAREGGGTARKAWRAGWAGRGGAGQRGQSERAREGKRRCMDGELAMVPSSFRREPRVVREG